MKSALEAMAGIAPRDEVEGMLAAQMVACHSAAMDCYRRAYDFQATTATEGRKMNLNFATKLTRTYALHMEALDKHRGKGAAEDHGRACPRPSGRPGYRRRGHPPRTGGSPHGNRRIDPMQRNCPCTRARDAVPAPAGTKPCRNGAGQTVGAGCMAARPRVRPRVTRTPGSTEAIRQPSGQGGHS